MTDYNHNSSVQNTDINNHAVFKIDVGIPVPPGRMRKCALFEVIDRMEVSDSMMVKTPSLRSSIYSRFVKTGKQSRSARCEGGYRVWRTS